MSYLCSYPGVKCVLLLAGARRLAQDPLAAVQEPALSATQSGRVHLNTFWQTRTS